MNITNLLPVVTNITMGWRDDSFENIAELFSSYTEMTHEQLRSIAYEMVSRINQILYKATDKKIKNIEELLDWVTKRKWSIYVKLRGQLQRALPWLTNAYFQNTQKSVY